MWMSYKQVDNQKNIKTEDHQRTWNMHDHDNNAILTPQFDGAFTLFDIEYRYIYKTSTDPMEICVGARMCITLTHPFLFRGKKVCVSTIHIRGAILIHSHNSIQAIFSFMCLCVDLSVGRSEHTIRLIWRNMPKDSSYSSVSNSSSH